MSDRATVTRYRMLGDPEPSGEPGAAKEEAIRLHFPDGLPVTFGRAACTPLAPDDTPALTAVGQ